MGVELRPFAPGDAAALLALFQDTVRRVNARDYAPEQVAVWSRDRDLGEWRARFAGRFAPVAVLDGEPVGFCDLAPEGYLDRFYVAADHQGRGVGSALMDALLAEARRTGIARVHAEVSLTARPFFERHGFAVVAPQTVVVNGVEFVNFLMERELEG